ncbi:MAG: lipocalin family protein [Cytophagales bacterium]|nr:lipocalin family protein [Bernardetiaceae bacterium]MDW8209992.1 lipocalin family protein [Cytophagales bacterium]
MEKVVFRAIALLSLALVGVLVFQCGKKGTKAKTPVELITGTWRVSRVLLNGNPDNTGNYSAFRITFQSASGNPTNYNVIPGNAPAKPNINPANTGPWALTNNDTQIVLDRGTPNEIVLAILELTETSLRIRFKLPRNVDKTEPEYTFELVKVQ